MRNVSMSYFSGLIIDNLSEEITVVDSNTRYMSVKKLNEKKEYASRVPFGMNFFIGFIGLILISSSRKFYLIEISVQVIFGVIIFLSFLYGVKGSTFLLRISDMASVYFLPLSSLFMVLLAFIEKKAYKETEINEV